jgi:D-alanine-D-alanine ligase
VKVVVLGGGVSPERDVSLRSAMAVASALQEVGFESVEIDPSTADFLETIDQESIVFPILHGAGGEDGTIQKTLENLALPFLGSGSESSKSCFDKWITREVLQQHGLPVAQGEHVTIRSYDDSKLRHKPHVLKAVGGGSSIGTYMVHDLQQISKTKVEEVFTVSEWAVVEEFVEGVEITIPILDMTALPVIEIKPPTGGEFDYENKYNGQTQETCPAVSIDEITQVKAQKVAEEAHRVLGCRHLSRVDLIVRSDNSFVILEVNTIPGMTDQSLYPKSAQVAGLTFPHLMKRFIEMVKRDYEI